ncbi:MAG TPA: hypothetical protein VG223_08510 [Solirubrobacteraceae bacterium]|jgi:hypothetical protein|nr:hypothetical protein [Solirubrobacteraceae bacterium]
MDDTEIAAVVNRLARPHSSGGKVIERAAILAAGADSAAIVAWILDHSGTPEQNPSTSSRRGLHSARLADSSSKASGPNRFVLPAGVL